MAEYIDREAMLKRIKDDFVPLSLAMVFNHIHNAPAADVAPVVHGRWIEREDPMLDTYYTCSACNEDFYIEPTGDTAKDLFTYTYCPNCGAKMDGGDNDGAD